MGTFFDSFAPALTGALAQAPLAGAQGHLQGLQAITALAQMQQQIQQQQIANQQAKEAFPLQQQQLRQQLQMNAAPQWQVRQPGTTLEQINPLTGHMTGEARQVPLNPLQQAQQTMYQGGGMYPPGSVEEMMKRKLALDPDDPIAAQYFSTIQRKKAQASGVPGLYDPETIQTMAERATMDPSYHAVFSGPYGAANRQAFDAAVAKPKAGGGVPGRAAQIINKQADTKMLRDTLSDFSPKGKSGTSVKIFNVAINHMDTLERLANALGSGDFQSVNRFNQTLATWKGSPKVTSFESAKHIVTDEVAKAIVAGATAMGDRDTMAAKVAASQSPEQLAGTLKGWRNLMAGQLEGIELQYTTGTGRTDFAKRLTPAAQRALKGVSEQQPAPASQAPTIGAKEDGYLYLGGDPSKQESWEKLK